MTPIRGATSLEYTPLLCVTECLRRHIESFWLNHHKRVYNSFSLSSHLCRFIAALKAFSVLSAISLLPSLPKYSQQLYSAHSAGSIAPPIAPSPINPIDCIVFSSPITRDSSHPSPTSRCHSQQWTHPKRTPEPGHYPLASDTLSEPYKSEN